MLTIEFLGTGGATPVPRPSCHCKICKQARERGLPFTRTGPSIFLHGPNVLIDTPEESAYQLNRSKIDNISGCFYSHWHPDHTMGRRVWETRNMDFRSWPRASKRTNIYLPEQVALDFRERLGLWEHFEFMAERGIVQIIEMQDGITVNIGGVDFYPFRVAEDYVYAFLLETPKRRVLIAPDELHQWLPPDLGPLDLAILPMGVVEFDPFTEERRIPISHPILSHEATFEDTLEIITRLKPVRTILTHIEEADQLGYNDLIRLQVKLREDGLNIQFAHDLMTEKIR